MKIKILWTEYDFLYQPCLLDEDGAHCFGFAEYPERRIRIEELIPDDQKRVEVIHELDHTISYLFGLDLTEVQIRGLSHGFYAVLKDNPGLAAHIVPGGKR